MAKPKLALVPSAQGSKFYSVLPSSGVGDFTFSRSGSATRINSQGLIETVGNGVSRLNYPMIDGKVVGCPHHILEPQITNLIPYSEDFTNAEWAKINLTVLGNQVISPDGTLSADKVSSNTSNSTHFLQEFLSTGNTVNVSIFVKNEDADYIQLTNPSSGAIFINFDIKNGLIGSKGSLISNEKIENYGNGWYRISATLDNTGVDNRYIRFYIVSSANASFNESWQPSSNISFYIWGGQAELNSYSTSYIPTNGSTVTRSAETANGSGDASTFNDSEGVLMAEISALANDGIFRNISINGTATNVNTNRLQIYFRDTADIITFYMESENSTQFFLQFPLDVKSNNKLALKYSANSCSFWINGIKVGEETNKIMPTGLSRLDFVRQDGNDEFFYGNTKQIQYFDSVLNDSDLEKLTSWVSFSDMANGQLYTIE